MSKEKEQEYHVISITPNQQAALRYCMLNWVQQKTIFYINALRNKDKIEYYIAASESMAEAFVRYDEIAGVWPIITGSSLKGPIQLYYFDPERFRVLKQALNLYNNEIVQHVLGDVRARLVEAQMEELNRLFHESTKFTFTLMELKIKTGGQVK